MAITSPAGADHRRHDLNLRGTFIEFQEDRDRTGRYTEGDRLDFDFELRDRMDRKRFAGDGDGECVVTEVVFGDVFGSFCQVEFDLLDGRLYLEGEINRRAFEGRQAFTLRVVDGSRHYSEMTGEATFFADDEWRGGAEDPRECRSSSKQNRKDKCRGIHDVDEDFTVFVHFYR